MLNLLNRYKHIIADFKIKRYVNEGSLFACKIQISFSDKSTLEVKEYRFSNNERKYAFHWMNKKGEMIIRWDNAAHWKHLPTFPHHKHIGKEVFASTEITLAEVLQVIEKQLILQ